MKPNFSIQSLQRLKKKIPNISGFGTTANLNTKSISIQNKIPETTNLITKVALNTKII